MVNRIIKKYLGMALVIAAIAYFGLYLHDNVSKLPDINWGVGSVLVIIGSVIIYVLGVLAGSVAWAMLVRTHKVNVRLIDLVLIYSRAQFGKYLPGNIGHHVGRVYLAKEKNLPVSLTLQTMVLESAWIVSLGGVLSIIAASYMAENILAEKGIHIQIEWVLLLAVVAFFLPMLLVKVLNNYYPQVVERLTGNRAMPLPSVVQSIKIVFFMFLCFFVVGLIMEMLIGLLMGGGGVGVPFLTCTYALSWIVGYFVPGAPAGLGVREVVLVSMLEKAYGPGIAISISILLRLITVLGDGVAFAIASIMYTRMEKRSS